MDLYVDISLYYMIVCLLLDFNFMRYNLLRFIPLIH